MTIRAAILFALSLCAGGLRADQLDMQNGDHYAGKVISMTADKIVFQSDVLGRITIPRVKVANINLAAMPVAPPSTNHPVSSALARTNNISGASSNLVEMVRRQFLSDAGPEANGKFDELSATLFTGKFDVGTIRTEAKKAADQIRELKRQGGDVGEPMNSYLAILDKFLKESAPPAPAAHSAPIVVPATNSAPSPVVSAAK